MNMVDNFIWTMTQQVSAPASQPAKTPADGTSSFQKLLQQTQESRDEAPVQDAPQNTPADKPVEEVEHGDGQSELNLYYQQMMAAQVMPVVQMTPEQLVPVEVVATAPVAAVQPQTQPVQPEQMTAQPEQAMPKPEQPVQTAQQPVQTADSQTAQTTAVAQFGTKQAAGQTEEAPRQEGQTGRSTDSAVATPVAETKITAPERGENPGQQSGAKLDDGSPQQNEIRGEAAVAGQETKLFPMADSVAVKVGDTPVLDSTATDLDAQLAKQVDRGLEAGSQRVEIKLTPEHLGEVTIEMTRSQDGSLQVTLSAGTEKGAALLEKHMSGLESILASTTRAPVQVEVQRQPESQNAQQHQQPQDQERQHSQGGQEQQQNQRRQQSEDFLQQLRLGLNTPEETAS